MKLIELLIDMASTKKLPQKIVIGDNVFYLNKSTYKKSNGYSLGEVFNLDEHLNDEVIALDEKIIDDKPKKTNKMAISDYKETMSQYQLDIIEHINKIIDTQNYLLEKSDK